MQKKRWRKNSTVSSYAKKEKKKLFAIVGSDKGMNKTYSLIIFLTLYVGRLLVHFLLLFSHFHFLMFSHPFFLLYFFYQILFSLFCSYYAYQLQKDVHFFRQAGTLHLILQLLDRLGPEMSGTQVAQKYLMQPLALDSLNRRQMFRMLCMVTRHCMKYISTPSGVLFLKSARPDNR